MKTLLTEMGLGRLFNAEAGDFCNMGDGNLTVDNVIQQTFIQVDEEGTEAAAATVVSMLKGGCMSPIDDEFVIKVDRPFGFWIVEHGQRIGNPVVMFSGKVLDPTIQ